MNSRLIITALLLWSLATSAKVFAQQPVETHAQEPFSVLAQKLSSQLMNGIEDLNLAPEVEQEALARQIVSNELAPYLDLRFSSLKLLGKHVRHLDKQQMDEFTGLIENQLIKMYAKILIEYKDSKIALSTLQTNQGRKFAEAAIKINRANQSDAQLILKFRQSEAGQWRIYDVVSRQVSQLSVKRQSLVLKISEIGFEQLNQELRLGKQNRI
ncbi:ABC transporter substrate-binding protein [Pseudoalteromonas luteoviolacea]|uniref:MlaC/ttg2D family ABC transporter substrate-binding protein n=1 Tax=Pseudoalteromonas luteoviolacea TaxID=43657 RepID=UPI001B35C77C|nr:ABC transporter substrate-binding protein [Pseudoalteromonas luteoviolacea]MBQ4810832.1 ABC transporter substrate-binding protein [Pseudoalteromonas luteoviolacea]